MNDLSFSFMSNMLKKLLQTNIKIISTEKINKILFELLGKYCDKTAEQVEQDASRDFWLSATEAVEYGIIDEVVTTKKGGQ